MSNAPGRLGDPNMTFLTDPRADPRIRAAVEVLGGFTDGVELPGADASYEDALAYCTGVEEMGAASHDMMREALPEWPTVTSTTQTITGVDGNDIQLYIHRPNDVTGPVPCLYHTHGGGMVIMTAADPSFVRLRNDLAATGVVVVGVEFRNGGGRLGPHPFPAGLNDCASGLKWVVANKEELGVDKVVICGESGGGNLSIATTLKAKQEGWLEAIDGVYAMCPYISGSYSSPPADLVSLRENDGYMLDCAGMGLMVKAYDPTGEHASNPLAWPLQGEVEDLAGLPPHVIFVNELDPLRDEGLAFYRKLVQAGVPAIARTSMGTPHAGDQMFVDVVPQAYQDLCGAIVGFARSL